MYILLRDVEPLDAQRIASYLLAEGVIAAPVHDMTAMGYNARPTSRVMLLDGRDKELAARLVAELEQLPRTPALEGGEEEPDLSQLDRAMVVRCDSCSAEMRANAGHAACPVCSAEVDIADLVVQEHGPEALEACYPREDSIVVKPGSGVPCLKCGYWLAGLGVVGVCPECSTTYDKKRTVEMFLRRLSQGRYMADPGTT